MKRNNLLKVATSGLILFSSFNDIYAEETKILNLDPFRVEIVGNRMGDADSEKIYRYAEYLYKSKRYGDALFYLENIRQYSRSDIVDDAIYTLANIHLKKTHDSRDSFDYALTLFEQMIFTHPEGNIVNEGYVKRSLENIIDFCVEYSDYPHLTWTFNILENYPGIDEEDVDNNKVKVEGFLKKEIPEISFRFTISEDYDHNNVYTPVDELYRPRIFDTLAEEFGFFKSRKMVYLIDKLKEGDKRYHVHYRTPIRGNNFYEFSSAIRFDNRMVESRTMKIGYPKGTTLEHFLKDIGIKDPMKWWETLE